MGRGFVLAGARIVVASRKRAACEGGREASPWAGRPGHRVPTHLGELEALEALLQKAGDECGGVDVVVNNVVNVVVNALAQPLGR